MQSALYYPHTEIRSRYLLGTSLLLWDKVQFIVPLPNYKPYYENSDVAKAIELIGEQHYPTPAEKELAHRFVEDFVTRQLPEAFLYRDSQLGQYRIYPEKLLPETWELLREAKMAGRPLKNYETSAQQMYGVPLNQICGLAIMSLLADCCAGSTRIRVTDRAAAYVTVLSLLRDQTQEVMSGLYPHCEELVPISLSVVNVEAISLSELIKFREREAKEGGHTLRDLRHRYVEALETYARKLAITHHNDGDQKEIKRQFEQDMKDDLAFLRDEFGFAKKGVAFTKTVIGTVIAGALSVAAAKFSFPPELADAALTWGGVPAVVYGGLSVRNKYQKARREILQKHPMAYLYEFGNATPD
jgi:hypothetical protein